MIVGREDDDEDDDDNKEDDEKVVLEEEELEEEELEEEWTDNKGRPSIESTNDAFNDALAITGFKNSSDLGTTGADLLTFAT